MVQYSLEEIIKGCKSNSRKHQEYLYLIYFDKMYAMCLRHTGDKEKAMSIVNDGFLKIFKNIDKFSYKGSFEGWIRKIIFNTIRDFYRRKSNRVSFIEIHENHFSNMFWQNADYEEILYYIKRLPDKSREVFMLYAIEGYSHKEIADTLDINISTSKWHLGNARKKLKEILNNVKKNNINTNKNVAHK